MTKCAVKKCQNNSIKSRKKDGVTYHRFPRHELMKEKWRKLVAKERSDVFYKPNHSSVICSDHFLDSDIYYTEKGFKRLKKTAVPHFQFADDAGPSESKTTISKDTAGESTPSQSQILSDVILEQPEINSPSHKSMSSGLSSILDTPEISYYKKELSKCYSKLCFREKQVRNLKKRNKRLAKANLSLKAIVKDLTKKLLAGDSIRSNTEKNTDDDAVVE